MKKLLFLLLFPIVCLGQHPSNWDISRILFVPSGPAVPTIGVTPTTMNFSAVTGTASDYQTASYFLTALTNPMAINIPTGLEGSIDNGSTWHTGTFFGSITSSGGIRLRTPSTLAAGTYGPLTVAFTSTGATEKDITVNITIGAISLSVSPTTSTLNGTAGAAGSAASVILSFSNLTANITATGPTTPQPVELSLDNSSFSNPLTIPFTTPSPLTLYLRTSSASTAGSVSDTVRITSTGAPTAKIALNGTISSTPTVIQRWSFSLTTHTLTGWDNVAGDPHTGVRTSTGTTTGWVLSTIATANYVPNGTCAFDGNGTQSGTFISDGAGTSQAVMFSGYVNGMAYDHTKPQFKITGLNPAKTYNFKGTGVTQGGSLRVTDVHIEGAALSAMQSFTAKGNTANGVTYTNISPAADGSLLIWFNQDVTNIEQGHWDGMIIAENP